MDEPEDIDPPEHERLSMTRVPFAWKVAVAAFMLLIILGLAAIAVGPSGRGTPPDLLACRPSPALSASLADVADLTNQVRTTTGWDKAVAESSLIQARARALESKSRLPGC